MNNRIVCSCIVFCISMALFGGCKSASFNRSAHINKSVMVSDLISSKNIYADMEKVAKWQMDSIKHKGMRHKANDWTSGALYTGFLAWADVSKDSSYYTFMRHIGDSLGWKLLTGDARYHADNYCIGQMYCRMYEIYHDGAMIADLKHLGDELANKTHTESLEWKNKISQREWAWCDALFMGPPTLTMLYHETGNLKYMNLVDKLWWKTSDYLYDKKERLFYRDSRYFDKKEKNGQKVFWSRGNGWVLAGLARVIEHMPADYWDRRYWVKQFSDIAGKIASLQQSDGTWHASLLDPASYPGKETSGTAFYCYALAWGINNGILDAGKYTTVVDRAWEALVGCIHPNGMLGFAQPIGGEPHNVNYDDTEVYAVGAFLLAGKEMLKLTK